LLEARPRSTARCCPARRSPATSSSTPFCAATSPPAARGGFGIFTFHWSYSRDHGLLYGSTDGASWELIAETEPPEYGGWNRNGNSFEVPESLLGGSELWFKAELYSYGSSAPNGGGSTNPAQLGRYEIARDPVTAWFQVDLEGPAAAETGRLVRPGRVCHDRIMAVIITTPRTRLRELTDADAEFVLGLVNEPSFLANIGDKGVRTLEDAREFIADGPWRRGQPEGHGQFLVELEPDRTPIGVCGILYRPALDVTDFGCAFLPAYWRQGFATETIAAVIEYGRSRLGLERIVGLTAPHNSASLGILAKLGMSYERTVKMTPDDPGTLLYS
jgi:RimJ/RimL family protein N-acetyltransferase